MASITFTNAGGITLTSNISYIGSQSTYEMIKFKNGDIYGNGIVIGGGGLTVIGAGESSDVIAANYSGGSEIMAIGSDGNVVVYTNVDGGWDSRKTFSFDTDGTFTATNTQATKHYVGSDGAYISYNSTTGAIEFNFA